MTERAADAGPALGVTGADPEVVDGRGSTANVAGRIIGCRCIGCLLVVAAGEESDTGEQGECNDGAHGVMILHNALRGLVDATRTVVDCMWA